MFKPADFELMSIDEVWKGPVPPAGFVSIAELEGGNGDCFGWYWPLGRERMPPVICVYYHDEPILRPAFSNTERFRDWCDSIDSPWSEEFDDAEPEFAPALFKQAKQHLGTGNIEGAIACARRACDSFPDSSACWLLLASQLRRVGSREASVEAALNAYRSSWCFGAPDDGVLNIIRGGKSLEKFADDPVVKRSDRLTTRFGGDKENANYPLIRECIDEYFARGEAVNALRLSQNYALMILVWETISFRERYGFDGHAWQKDFAVLCARHLGDSRTSVE